MTDKIARVWNGTEWVVVSAPVGVPNSIAVYQENPPISPVDGQMWVDSDNDETGNYFVSSMMDLGLLVIDINNIQTQIDLKSPKASPTFTGIPLAPTATAGTNTTQIATTAFVNSGFEKTIPLSSSAPTSPASSDLWVDSTDPAKPTLKVYNGTSWITAGSSITVDDDQIILASRVFG